MATATRRPIHEHNGIEVHRDGLVVRDEELLKKLQERRQLDSALGDVGPRELFQQMGRKRVEGLARSIHDKMGQETLSVGEKQVLSQTLGALCHHLVEQHAGENVGRFVDGLATRREGAREEVVGLISGPGRLRRDVADRMAAEWGNAERGHDTLSNLRVQLGQQATQTDTARPEAARTQEPPAEREARAPPQGEEELSARERWRRHESERRTQRREAGLPSEYDQLLRRRERELTHPYATTASTPGQQMRANEEHAFVERRRGAVFRLIDARDDHGLQEVYEVFENARDNPDYLRGIAQREPEYFDFLATVVGVQARPGEPVTTERLLKEVGSGEEAIKRIQRFLQGARARPEQSDVDAARKAGTLTEHRLTELADEDRMRLRGGEDSYLSKFNKRWDRINKRLGVDEAAEARRKAEAEAAAKAAEEAAAAEAEKKAAEEASAKPAQRKKETAMDRAREYVRPLVKQVLAQDPTYQTLKAEGSRVEDAKKYAESYEDAVLNLYAANFGELVDGDRRALLIKASRRMREVRDNEDLKPPEERLAGVYTWSAEIAIAQGKVPEAQIYLNDAETILRQQALGSGHTFDAASMAEDETLRREFINLRGAQAKWLVDSRRHRWMWDRHKDAEGAVRLMEDAAAAAEAGGDTIEQLRVNIGAGQVFDAIADEKIVHHRSFRLTLSGQQIRDNRDTADVAMAEALKLTGPGAGITDEGDVRAGLRDFARVELRKRAEKAYRDGRKNSADGVYDMLYESYGEHAAGSDKTLDDEYKRVLKGMILRARETGDRYRGHQLEEALRLMSPKDKSIPPQKIPVQSSEDNAEAAAYNDATRRGVNQHSRQKLCEAALIHSGESVGGLTEEQIMRRGHQAMLDMAGQDEKTFIEQMMLYEYARAMVDYFERNKLSPRAGGSEVSERGEEVRDAKRIISALPTDMYLEEGDKAARLRDRVP